MPSPEPIRAFVVGCPRSGTTLLQSLVAAHRSFASAPETHFFRLYATTGLPDLYQAVCHRELRDWMAGYFERLDRPGWKRAFSRWYLRRRTYADLFVRAFDDLAAAHGSEGWLEKTPGHLEYIELIEELVDRPRFVHIVRRGADTVASLHAVTHEYPDDWSGAMSIDECIDRWSRSVARTDARSGDPNHFAVQYEQLASRPEPVLREICEFLGVRFEPDALDRYEEAADRVVDEGEPWKASNREAIREPDSQRFYGRFEPSEREYILRRLSAARTDWPVEPVGTP